MSRFKGMYSIIIVVAIVAACGCCVFYDLWKDITKPHATVQYNITEADYLRLTELLKNCKADACKVCAAQEEIINLATKNAKWLDDWARTETLKVKNQKLNTNRLIFEKHLEEAKARGVHYAERKLRLEKEEADKRVEAEYQQNLAGIQKKYDLAVKDAKSKLGLE